MVVVKVKVLMMLLFHLNKIEFLNNSEDDTECEKAASDIFPSGKYQWEWSVEVNTKVGILEIYLLDPNLLHLLCR